MRPLAEAAIKIGLVDDESLAQFKRWGMVPKDMTSGSVDDPQEAVGLIQDALETEEQVRLQYTDLDVLQYFMDKKNQIRGQLVLIDTETNQRGTKTVVFAIRQLQGRSQYIIKWMSDAVTELLTNGRSYLRWTSPDTGESCRARMLDYDDLYFGDTRMFLVCPGMEDDDDESE